MTGKNEGKPTILALHPHATRQLQALDGDFDVASASEEDLDSVLATEGSRIIGVVAIGRERFDGERLDRMPNLQLIHTMASGYEGIDVAAAKARGVRVSNIGPTLAGDMADYAMALILGARKRIAEGDAWVRQGLWGKDNQPSGRSLAQEKVGIVGMGHIGQALARRCEPFFAEIGWWGPNPKELPWRRHQNLMELAEWSSILVLAARSDTSTHGMITGGILEAIGPDGLFVNMARGFMVDEDALIGALKVGRLGQAALDVFAEEPTSPERWQDVPNVLLSPHVAGSTLERIEAGSALLLSNVRSLLTGEPPQNIVA